MAEEYVWECKYCGDTFGTKEECDRRFLALHDKIALVKFVSGNRAGEKE